MTTLSEGRVRDAVRASIAIPYIWKPWQIGGRWLLDGCVSDPLPVDVAIRESADGILAMGFESPYPKAIRSATRYAFQVNSVYTNNLLRANYAFHNLAHHAEIIPVLPTSTARYACSTPTKFPTSSKKASAPPRPSSIICCGLWRRSVPEAAARQPDAPPLRRRPEAGRGDRFRRSEMRRRRGHVEDPAARRHSSRSGGRLQRRELYTAGMALGMDAREAEHRSHRMDGLFQRVHYARWRGLRPGAGASMSVGLVNDRAVGRRRRNCTVMPALPTPRFRC